MHHTPWGYRSLIGRAQGVVVVAVSFNARERRLVVDGSCWPADAGRLARAIRDAADPGRCLVLDMTRVAGVPHEVAVAVTRACCAAEAEGARVLVWTLPGSVTERDLADATTGQSLLASTS